MVDINEVKKIIGSIKSKTEWWYITNSTSTEQAIKAIQSYRRDMEVYEQFESDFGKAKMRNKFFAKNQKETATMMGIYEE